MLRFNGRSILNLNEFKEYFNFSQAYNQIDELVDFSKAHCLPMKLLDKDSNPIVCLNKSFWIELLSHVCSQEKINYEFKTNDSYQNYIIDCNRIFYERDERQKQIREKLAVDIVPENHESWNCYVERAIEEFKIICKCQEFDLEDIIQDLKKPFTANDDYVEQVKSDMNVLDIPNRIKIICDEMVDLSDNTVNAKIILSCLCMQMITECGIDVISPKDCDIHSDENKYDKLLKQMECTEISDINVDGKASGIMFETPLKIESNKAVRERIEYLHCRKEPYIWYYVEKTTSDNLPTIQTIRIEAIEGSNDSLIIQLYSDIRKEIVYEFSMKVGDYRYCNIANEGITCVLPTSAEYKNRSISRVDYKKGDLYIKDKNKPIDECLRYDSCITCFDISDGGELYLRNGKVLAGRYELARRDKRIQDSLDLISYEEFVEVKLLEEGYLLLNNNSIVRSNIPEQNGKKKVSLYSIH